MREYRDFQRIRTRQDRVRRAVVLMLIVIVAGALLIVARGMAHGQTNIDESWQEIGQPPALSARVYLPAVTGAP